MPQPNSCALVPVVTVQLGEPATLTCVLTKEWLGLKILRWYKQDAGDSLRVIASMHKNANHKYGSGFSPSRLKADYHKQTINLTILRTVKEDEGMYHCAIMDWVENIWSGIYLSIKGKTLVNDPVRIGDSVNLECSVLSNTEKNNCTEDLKVFWFRSGSHKSYPEIIYTDDDCKKEDLRRCVYSLSKSVTSSDAGTYYCAVATCGEILFENGHTLHIGMILHYKWKFLEHILDAIMNTDGKLSLFSRTIGRCYACDDEDLLDRFCNSKYLFYLLLDWKRRIEDAPSQSVCIRRLR
uniref:Ig-like domain-containing protein n=1 Tax=Nothobranchius furzeri TaxID=105023 RepID=A0A8C6KES2_NOTFU